VVAETKVTAPRFVMMCCLPLEIVDRFLAARTVLVSALVCSVWSFDTDILGQGDRTIGSGVASLYRF
jgi:hypothetical protein